MDLVFTTTPEHDLGENSVKLQIGTHLKLWGISRAHVLAALRTSWL